VASLTPAAPTELIVQADRYSYNYLIDAGTTGDEWNYWSVTVPARFKRIRVRYLSVRQSGVAATAVAESLTNRSAQFGIFRRGRFLYFGSSEPVRHGRFSDTSQMPMWEFPPSWWEARPCFLAAGDQFQIQAPPVDANGAPTADYDMEFSFDVLERFR